METKKLTLEDIKIPKSSDFKTVFEVVTYSDNEKLIHFHGYCYCTGMHEANCYRHVEYCGFFVNIYEVLYKGLDKAESDNCELAKSYVKEVGTEEDVLNIYNTYVGERDGSCHAPTLLPINEFSDKTPDGIYILQE